MYLGINTRKLQQRNLKEVIGFAFMNQAAVFWAKQDYTTVVSLYEKARLFLPDDPLLKMLLGFNYLFVGKNHQGHALLREIQQLTFDEAVSKETIPEDYLTGKIDIAGIKAVFLPVDETRESILSKQKELALIVKKYPYYRAGLLHLATTWLQLNRQWEAREVLQQYDRLDPTNATVAYYLAILSHMRLDYTQSWRHLKQAEALTNTRHHHPKILNALRENLKRVSPE
jgi:tetratricopeptide (TPR) repeat protein